MKNISAIIKANQKYYLEFINQTDSEQSFDFQFNRGESYNFGSPLIIIAANKAYVKLKAITDGKYEILGINSNVEYKLLECDGQVVQLNMGGYNLVKDNVYFIELDSTNK